MITVLKGTLKWDLVNGIHNEWIFEKIIFFWVFTQKKSGFFAIIKRFFVISLEYFYRFEIFEWKNKLLSQV